MSADYQVLKAVSICLVLRLFDLQEEGLRRLHLISFRLSFCIYFEKIQLGSS